MKRILQTIKKHTNLLIKLSPLIAFLIPMLALYVLNPPDPNIGLSVQATFELMWKGRTFEVFFIWLVGLELILGWENLDKIKLTKLASFRSVAFIAALALPTIYIFAGFYMGLNEAIANWSAQSGVFFANSMPLAMEYLILSAFFFLLILLQFGFRGLKDFSVPAFFLIVVGALYAIDNIFPYGQFTPFQILVPTTTALAAAIMNLMGYTTSISYGDNSLQGNVPYLTAVNPNAVHPSTTFAVAWPCAGIESFLIFTVVVLLFLKRMQISWKAKIGYFAFGAAVTYVINALRIVAIFNIGMQYGTTSHEVDMFHFYYGPLYAVAWIVSYPLIIIGSRMLWNRLKNRTAGKGEVMKLPQEPLNPV